MIDVANKTVVADKIMSVGFTSLDLREVLCLFSTLLLSSVTNTSLILDILDSLANQMHSKLFIKLCTMLARQLSIIFGMYLAGRAGRLIAYTSITSCKFAHISLSCLALLTTNYCGEMK